MVSARKINSKFISGEVNEGSDIRKSRKSRSSYNSALERDSDGADSGCARIVLSEKILDK